MAADPPIAAVSKRAAPGRVLIVLLGAIGDVVRALPLLSRLRRAWPDAHIAWAVEPAAEPILKGHPWLDEVILFDRRRAFAGFVPFLRAVRARRFDLAIDLQRHFKSGIVSFASGAPERIGFHPRNTKELNHLFSTRHIAAQPNLRLKLMQYQAFGDALGTAPAPIEFGLKASGGERERALGTLTAARRPLLGVILGSSWPSRIYPAEQIAAVIRELAQPAPEGESLFPVLLGGPRDGKLADAVIAQLGGVGHLNLAGRTGLRDLIAIFAECAVAFGPDSGPMHIAAAVGCPIVSMWGATAADRSAPFGFAEYAVGATIPCHPCYLRECPIGRECMWRLRPATVAEAVRRALLASGRARPAAVREPLG